MQDVEVQEQIERDVARTHPDMHFFSGTGSPLHTNNNRLAGSTLLLCLELVPVSNSMSTWPQDVGLKAPAWPAHAWLVMLGS